MKLRILIQLASSLLLVILVQGCGSPTQVDKRTDKVTPERQAILDERNRQDGN